MVSFRRMVESMMLKASDIPRVPKLTFDARLRLIKQIIRDRNALGRIKNIHVNGSAEFDNPFERGE